MAQQELSDQAVADDRSNRDAFAASGGDSSKYLQALASGGNYKAYQAAQKAELDRQKATADIAHTGAQTQQATASAGKSNVDAQVATIEHVSSILATAKDPQSYAAARQAVGQMFPQALQNLPEQYDPMLVQSTIAGGVKRAEQLKAQHDAATAAETNRHNITVEGETGRHNRSSENIQIRGQNKVDERARETNGKAPAGYVWGPNGPDGVPTLIAAKGGPADLKMAGALNQDTQALTGATSSFDRLATAANEVLNHPGLKGITGIRGKIPNAPGSEAANAEALLGTLKSQVGFGVLQDMRNNSKTGGALGSVSDAEGKRLEANLAALDKSQSLEQFQANLKKIIEYSEGAKGRLREAYNLKHGQGSTNPVRTGGATGSFDAPTQPSAPAKTRAGASVSNW
jgi:hypothetical protein